MSFIVAIDGPAGSGKGSITELVAKKFKLTNIDTGAMYRCVTLEMLNQNVNLNELEKIKNILETIKIDIKEDNGKQSFFLNGEDVSDKIRTNEVTKIVSQVSAIKEVREKLVDLQRKVASGKDVIMEGRDITTVVFPNADVKIYLDADLEVRAKRRYRQNIKKNIETTYEEVLSDMEKRDKNDMTKEYGALKKAPGAVIIDSTKMSIKQEADAVIKVISKKKKEQKQLEKIYSIRPENTRKKIVRAIVKGFLNGLYVFVYRVKKVGTENLPKDGGYIICANHVNYLDAAAIVLCSKEKIRFIGKEDLFTHPILNWLAHLFDIIPIKRGQQDIEAMKRSIKALKTGEILGIFPEGTRKGLAKNAKVKNGAAFMALRTKSLVVPVGIQGSFKPFTKVTLNYGKPLDFTQYDKNDKDALDRATEEIMNNIIMLTNDKK